MTVSDAPGTAAPLEVPAPATASAPSALTPVFRELTTPSPLAQLPLEKTARSQRLVSLDIFRGLTIAAMIFVNNIDEEHTYWVFNHAKWNGWTPTDLIFPFFLFIVGVAMPFSFARRSQTTEQTTGRLLGRVWLRALSLWMLGQLLFAWPMPLGHALPDGFIGTKIMRIVSFVFVYGSVFALLIPWRAKLLQTLIPIGVAVGFYSLMVAMHFVVIHAHNNGWTGTLGNGILNPDRLRIPGVLQRIGLVYGIAGSIALLGRWWVNALSIVALCAIYCVLMFKVPYGPDHTRGKLDIDDNLSRYVDVKLFDTATQKHTYTNYPDNEGLISSIPAIATCLLGVLAGMWLRRTDRTPEQRGVALLAMAVPTLVLGWVLNFTLIPINKILWTPSYVFFTAGLAMLFLGSVFWLVDVLGYRRWSLPAVIFGMNAIAAYCAASIVPKMLDLIRIHHGENGETTGLYACAKHYYVNGAHIVCDWLANHPPHLTAIGNVPNFTVYQALFLVFVIWVLMSVLYACKIFVKV